MTFGGSAWARIGADKPPPPEARRPSREAMGLAGDEPRDGNGGDGGGGGGDGGGPGGAGGGEQPTTSMRCLMVKGSSRKVSQGACSHGYGSHPFASA